MMVWAFKVKRVVLHGATMALFASAATMSFAQYPNKPVKIIVPFPAGGTTDIVARAIAVDLQKALGQPFVVENRGGAGGNIGSEVVAKSPPDGYTLLMGTAGTHGVNTTLYPKLPYDAVKDFSPITLVAAVPNVLVAAPGFPVNSVQELITAAKKDPNKITFASSGNGTTIHLSAELFKLLTHTQMTHVPYKGSAAALPDVMSGQVNVMFDNAPSAMAQIKGGKLKAIAVTTPQRSPALPGVPTIAEAGVAGFEASSWFGLLAPAGTPKEVIDKLAQATIKSLQTPEMKERFSQQGAEAVGNTPEQFGDYIKSEIEKWGKVVKASGARVD